MCSLTLVLSPHGYHVIVTTRQAQLSLVCLYDIMHTHASTLHGFGLKHILIISLQIHPSIAVKTHSLCLCRYIPNRRLQYEYPDNYHAPDMAPCGEDGNLLVPRKAGGRPGRKPGNRGKLVVVG